MLLLRCPKVERTCTGFKRGVAFWHGAATARSELIERVIVEVSSDRRCRLQVLAESAQRTGDRSAVRSFAAADGLVEIVA